MGMYITGRLEIPDWFAKQRGEPIFRYIRNEDRR